MTQAPIDVEIPEHYVRLMDGFRLSLQVKRRAVNTIVIYMDAVNLLGRFLVEQGMPTEIEYIRREHIEAFILDLLSDHAPGTAKNRYKSLRVFFNWCVDEDEIPVSPMRRMHEPSVPDNPPPIIRADGLRALLKVCEGRDHRSRRDMAMLMLLIDTGIRRAECADILLEHVDLREQEVTVTGKGEKTRVVSIGSRTAQALDRYIRQRAKHKLASMPNLWLGDRGPVTKWGVREIVELRAKQAGLGHLHPHLFRHTNAHEWKAAGGSDEDLMQLMGWSSSEMVRRYGRSAAAERARAAHRKNSLGDRL